MVRLGIRLLLATLTGALAMGSAPAHAVQVDLIKIGTWTTAPGSATPDAGLQQGGRYVIHASYDPALTPTTVRNIGGLDFHVINLVDAAAAIGGDSLRVLIPMEGFDTSTPFVYDQNQADHFFFGTNVPQPEIHFTAAGGSAADFFGFEYEGDFEPGATGNFVEVFTEVAAIDIGGGTIVLTPSQVTQVLRDPTYEIAERSIDSLTDAIDPVAAAGTDKQYSASQLSVETAVDAFVDNDLGAARTDNEDFLTYDWTQGGAPLVGTMTTAMRPDGRTADDVNIAVAIQDSGLTTTLDTATWQVEVNEDLTGLGGSTDTMTVSYANALPSIVNASATAQGNDILFELSVDDPDLAVNALIADFEMLEVDLFLDGSSSPFTGLMDLLTTGSELVDHLTLLGDFGAGMHQLEVRATDRFLRDQGGFISAVIDFTVNSGTAPPTIPEPATLVLFAVGLASMAALLRRRRTCSVQN